MECDVLYCLQAAAKVGKECVNTRLFAEEFLDCTRSIQEKKIGQRKYEVQNWRGGEKKSDRKLLARSSTYIQYIVPLNEKTKTFMFNDSEQKRKVRHDY